MADPSEKIVAAAPGKQVVQTAGPSSYEVPEQKSDAAVVGAAPPSVAYWMGGPPPQYAKFASGSAGRPNIVHDHGFLDSNDGKHLLDKSKMRPPEARDHTERWAWLAKLWAAKRWRPELFDATTAYHHFHYGKGETLRFSYDKFVQQDASGRRALRSAIEDVIAACVAYHDQTLSTGDPAKDNFEITSDAIVGSRKPDARWPYPATENWQKAIGGHSIWLWARVMVAFDPQKTTRTFSVTMCLVAEDMYNFNPGALDIKTGIPDSANGRFELCGMAQEFLQQAQLFRAFSFHAPAKVPYGQRYEPPGLDIDAIVKPPFTYPAERT